MSGNTTVRLVSGGTLQVRTGVLKGVGPAGPQGIQGATGPQPVFGTPVITGTAYGAEPTVSITGSGTSGSPYILNMSIPTEGPGIGIGTVTSLPAGSTPTASFDLVGTTYELSLGIPAGNTGPAGSATTGFATFKKLVGLEMQAATSAASSNSNTVTINNTAGIALIAMLNYYNSTYASTEFSFTSNNWKVYNGETLLATVTAINTGSNTLTVTPNVTISSGTTITVRNDGVTVTTVPTGEFTTTNQGLRYPTSMTARALIPYYLQQIATTADTRVVQRFTDASDRSTKRNPASVGEVSYLQDTGGLYVYADSAHRLLGQVQIVTVIPTTGSYPAGTIFLKVV